MELINGILNIKSVAQPRPHLLIYSRHCRFGPVVVPFSSATTYLPQGAEGIPDLSNPKIFKSIKEKPEWAKDFLESLTRIVAAYGLVGAQWTIGRSTGGIDPRGLGLPAGTMSFNEAVAVVFALVSLDVGGLLNGYCDKFLLLADLGGGFLDISVADELNFSETSGTAKIVNYGGYPLGVDRVATRFSQDPVQNPQPLIDYVTLAIDYHLWDYMQRPGAKQEGFLVLTGGGFQRLDRNALDRSLRTKLKTKPKLSIQYNQFDTKYLTLLGLGRMAQLGYQEGAGADDISYRDPRYHAQHLVQQGATDDTWYAMLDSLRNASY